MSKDVARSFSSSGFIGGPEWYASGKHVEERTLLQLLNGTKANLTGSAPALGSYSVSFHFKVWGSVTNALIKAGPGRRTYHRDDRCFMITIGVPMEVVDMPMHAFRLWFSKTMLEATKSLAEFARRKEPDFPSEDLVAQAERAMVDYLAEPSSSVEERKSVGIVRVLFSSSHHELQTLASFANCRLRTPILTLEGEWSGDITFWLVRKGPLRQQMEGGRIAAELYAGDGADPDQQAVLNWDIFPGIARFAVWTWRHEPTFPVGTFVKTLKEDLVDPSLPPPP